MTQSRGKLFVFEGPDGVGKSALAEWFKTHLQESGTKSTGASAIKCCYAVFEC